MKRKYKYIGITAGSLARILVVLLRVASKNVHAGPREENSFPPAAVALVKRTSISNTVTLSGEFVPFQQVDVHAKGGRLHPRDCY